MLVCVPTHDHLIRRAGLGDAGTIGAIYDEAIATGVATFAAGLHDADERAAWLAGRGDRAPVWVLERDGGVVAWAALAPFSHREWYDGVAEYTVYVSGTAQGAGVGGQMLDHLIGEAPALGYWKLVGMVLEGNDAGLALARRRGFREVGTHRAHGHVNGAWRDVTVVELHLEQAR
ncbi:MAG: N-acetyltransferase family protein [Actinobacteria bacterium]|nr:N-acetyltransferase family protein [Actinomycetota bacterium]